MDAFFAHSFLIDEADWARLSGEAKVHAQTASFTLPHLDGQQMPDIDDADVHHGWMVNGVTEIAMKVKKADTSKRPTKNRGRKEATATDLPMFMKQFQEAKLAEVKSWKDNEVYDLVDLRKLKCQLGRRTLGPDSETAQ